MTYLIVFIILCIAILTGRATEGLTKRKSFVFFSILLLGLLSGFRYQNSWSDFLANYRQTAGASSLSWYDIIAKGGDAAQYAIKKMVMSVFQIPQMFFIIIAMFFCTVMILNAYKYAKNIYLYVFLFYTVLGYFSANNLIVQSIAVAVVTLSWGALINKKGLLFIILMIIAIAIHQSAIVFLPLFILSYIRFNKNCLYTYLILAFLCYLNSSKIIKFVQLFMYSNYVGSDHFGVGAANPLRLTLVLIGIVVLVMYIRNSVDMLLGGNKKQNLFINNIDERFENFIRHGTMMYIILTVLSVTRMMILARVAMYFIPCFLICIDRAVCIYAEDSIVRINNKKIVKTAIIAYGVAWFLIMLYTENLTPWPYVPFWKIVQ